MRNEYNRVGDEYSQVTELEQPHENLSAADSEFFGNRQEYWETGNEFLQTDPVMNSHEEKRTQDAKKRAQHKKLLKQMVYTVASVATVATMSQTIELPQDVQDVVSEIVATAEPVATPEVTLPPIVQQVADYTIVFTGNDELTKEEVDAELAKYQFDGTVHVVIEEGITGIGEDAFAGFEELVSVDIADSVTVIGEHAFSGCKNLVIEKLDTANRTIGTSAFYKAAIGEVVVSQTYVTTGYNPTVFHGANVGKVSFEAGITKIPDRALFGCDSITEIDIPDTVTELGVRAISGCEGLRNIVIPSGVVKLGESAFAGCKNLEKVEIPDSVTDIGEHAFSDCGKLVIEKLDTANRTIGTSAFYKVAIGEVVVSQTYVTTGYNPTVFHGANVGEVSFEAGITKIPDRALAGCDSITEVVIPDTVTEIGNSAFHGCEGLEEVKLSSDLAELGESAFSGCKSLEKITIPDSVTVIGLYAFNSCNKLVIEKFDTANRAIRSSAFSGVTIGEVVISQTYKATGYSPNVFYNTNVGKVSFEPGITKIPDRALAGCTSITELVIPDTVTEIGELAFWNCDGLTKLEIPGSVMDIGANAFTSCENLIIEKLDTNNRTIGDSSFNGVTIEEVVISQTYKTTGYSPNVFYNTNVGKVSFESGITKIPDRALAGCTSITELVIPDTVTEIGEFAFWGCDNLVLVTTSGSAAETYAIEEGIPYRIQ